jgi:hypothetical protein
VALLTSIQLFGQSDRKFAYKLNSEAELIIIDTIAVRGRDTSGIKLTIRDNNNSPISHCKVKIENTDTVFNKLIDQNGIAFLNVPNGNWTLKISSPEFKEFSTRVQINKNEELYLTIHLIELEDIITIYSQSEISPHELDIIKYCIGTSIDPNDCIKKEYQIVLEI